MNGDSGWALYVSYSWEEEKRTGSVDQLESQCKSSRFDLKRDTKEISDGDYFSDLANAMGASARCLVLLSEPYLLKSRWCLEELNCLVRKGRYNETWWVLEAEGFSLEDFLSCEGQLAAFRKRCEAVNERRKLAGKEADGLNADELLCELSKVRDSLSAVNFGSVGSQFDWSAVIDTLEAKLPNECEYRDDDSELRATGLLELSKKLDKRLDHPELAMFRSCFEERLNHVDQLGPHGTTVNSTTLGGRLCCRHPEELFQFIRAALNPAVEDYIDDYSPGKKTTELVEKFVLFAFLSTVQYRWVNRHSDALQHGEFKQLSVDIDDAVLRRLVLLVKTGRAPLLRYEFSKTGNELKIIDPNEPENIKSSGDTEKNTIAFLGTICEALGISEERPREWNVVELKEEPKWEKLFGGVNASLGARNLKSDAVRLSLPNGRYHTEIGKLREFLPELQVIHITGSNGEETLIFPSETIFATLRETLRPIAKRLKELEPTNA